VYAHTLIKQAEKVQTNVCQKADGNSFLGQKKSADGGIHATRRHNNVISVFRKAKRTA
jgi:hypothetical protein